MGITLNVFSNVGLLVLLRWASVVHSGQEPFKFEIIFPLQYHYFKLYILNYLVNKACKTFALLFSQYSRNGMLDMSTLVIRCFISSFAFHGNFLGYIDRHAMSVAQFEYISELMYSNSFAS